MNQRYWLIPAAFLFGLLLVIPGQSQDKQKDKKQTDKKVTKEKDKKVTKDKDKKTKPKPKAGSGGAKLEWTAFNEGQKPFYQMLSTKTKQTLKVSGMDNKQDQKQVFWFKWTPKKADGAKYVVEQEIVGLEMDINIGGNKITFKSWDPNQPNNPMTQFFKSLVGSKFTLTIEEKEGKLKVKKVDGVKEMVAKLSAVNQAMKPLLEKILSDESVKHMADPVLGVIPAGGEVKDSWGDKDWSVLDMGPIGKYKTKNTYTVEANNKNADPLPIKVATVLEYEAPKGKDAKELPFVIKDAKLASKDSGGTIEFDRKKGRIKSSKLNVKLEGTLTVEIAATSTVVELNQDQEVQLQTHDEGDMGLPDWLKKGNDKK